MNKHKKNLFWDLGNTLIKIDMLAFAQHIGLLDFMLYPLLNRAHPKQILNKSLELLNMIDAPEFNYCNATALGRPLPPIACQWLSGQLPHKEVRAYLEAPLTTKVPEGFFSSQREARLVQNMLKILTDPQALVSSLSIIKEGIKLLKECAEQYDDQGNQLHTLFILSNWDPYSFEQIMNTLHLKELFSYFERSNLIISGNIGSIKPHDAIYSYVLTTYDLEPSDCILIDDQPENIIGAQKNGMHGILLKNGNYKEVRKQLRDLNVLPA